MDSAAAPATTTTEGDFQREQHVAFLRRCVRALPHQYQSQDANHLTLVYFVLGALDLLQEPLFARPSDRDRLVAHVYACQLPSGGFVGARDAAVRPSLSLANTYVALCLLKMAGDDLSRVDRPSLADALRALQRPDGSFAAADLPGERGECDMRFVYSACAVAALADLWDLRPFNAAAAKRYVFASQRPDGAFGQGPMLESHGGSTFCAIAALSLLGCDLTALPLRAELVRWLASRQVSGFQGRLGKDPDSCYSFWIGASLAILGEYERTVDTAALTGFVLSCQFDRIGGFSKYPDVVPDVLHTYMSLCGLGIAGFPGLAPIDCRLNVTLRALSSSVVADESGDSVAI